MPRKQCRMVLGWLATHEDEVCYALSDTARGVTFTRIDGLYARSCEYPDSA